MRPARPTPGASAAPWPRSRQCHNQHRVDAFWPPCDCRLWRAIITYHFNRGSPNKNETIIVHQHRHSTSVISILSKAFYQLLLNFELVKTKLVKILFFLT